MKKLFFVTLLFASSILLFSCGGKKNEAAEEKPKEEVHADENVAELTHEQVKTIGIELGSVERKELTHSVKANGILTVPNNNKAFVTSLSGGVIRTLLVQPGSYVKEGQTIATIVNPQLIQTQQQLQQVNAHIALTETEVKRQRQLVEGNAAPLKRLQQAESELATLQAQKEGLEKELRTVGASLSFSSTVAIKAPISGTVSKVIAQLGSNADVNTPLAEIVNNSQLHLDLYVYEKDLPNLKPEQTIHFTLTNNPGREYDAQIYSIGTAFEKDSKTVPVHARVSGDKTGLIDGMNITALVSLDKSTVPAVPVDAIVTYQGQDYIFAVKSTDTDGIHFERIPVAKGTVDVGYAEVTLLKPLPADAKIVTKGSFFVLAKMTNTEGGDDHH
jgi:RND family efflux transporter MFP subunit